MRIFLFCALVILALAVSVKIIYLTVSREGKEGSNLALILFFYLLLIVPASHLSGDDVSDNENRWLANEPKVFLSNVGLLNANFGKQFDLWMDDRFRLRDLFIDAFCSILWNINKFYSIAGQIMDKKTAWMFAREKIKDEGDLSSANDVLKALKDFNEYLLENEIKLYVLIVPAKEDIYRDELSFYMKDKKITKGNIIRTIQKSFDQSVVFPYYELKDAAKKDYVFFKSDHHWTDWGAFIGYQQLMKEIKKDFAEIKIASMEDYKITKHCKVRAEFGRSFGIGHTAYLLRLKDKQQDDFLKTEYSYYDPKTKTTTEYKIENKIMSKSFKNREGGRLRAVICGSSMTENFLQFFPQSFAEVFYIRMNGPSGIPSRDLFKIFKNYKQYIEDFKPDIFVICQNAPAIENLADLMRKD